MIVVSDASPLTALHAIGRLDLLEALYRGILIPALRPELEALTSQANFWLAESLRRELLELAGEA